MTHKLITVNEPASLDVAHGFTLGVDVLALVAAVLFVVFFATMPSNKVSVAATAVAVFSWLSVGALFQTAEVGTFLRNDSYEVDYVRPIFQSLAYAIIAFSLVRYVHARVGRDTEFFVLAMGLLVAVLQGAAAVSTEYRIWLFLWLSVVPAAIGFITLVKDARMWAPQDESLATRLGPWLVLLTFGAHYIIFMFFRSLGHSAGRILDGDHAHCYAIETWVYFALDLLLAIWFFFAYAIYTDLNYTRATNLIERMFGRDEFIETQMEARNDRWRGYDEEDAVEMPGDREDETGYVVDSTPASVQGDTYLLTETRKKVRSVKKKK